LLRFPSLLVFLGHALGILFPLQGSLGLIDLTLESGDAGLSRV
jgi:hypothetical protein